MPTTHVAPGPTELALLIADLQRAALLRTPEWIDAFGAVRRHHFLPRCYAPEHQDNGTVLWRELDSSHPHWLSTVYSDQALGTALDPSTARPAGDGRWSGEAICSSTRPSVMAHMLEDLDVRSDHRVLEIGLGTGYQTAILARRLSAPQVYSLDLDPATVNTARQRLADIGCTPHLAVSDGYQQPLPLDDPVDRIISTCSAPTIPTHWLEHTRPGGRILTDLSNGVEGGLALMTVDNRDHAHGRFTRPPAGRLMRARHNALTYSKPPTVVLATPTGARPSAVTAADIQAHHGFRLLLALTFPHAVLDFSTDPSGSPTLQLHLPDGTWARPPADPTDNGLVTYGGTYDLWSEVEVTWQWWNARGRPDQTHFSITLEPRGLSITYLPDRRSWVLDA